MATTALSPAAKLPTSRVPMDSLRRTALVAGIFYVITFISIPTLFIYGPVRNHRDWILSSGGHTAVLIGGLLEVIVALAGIGTAVTLYPILKRQNEGAALGFVIGAPCSSPPTSQPCSAASRKSPPGPR
jgi:cytochrome c biogenesis protein CcdA